MNPAPRGPSPHDPPSTYRLGIAKQEEFAQSCGAAGLLCAAMELGRTELWNGCPLDTVSGQAEPFMFQSINGVPPGADLHQEGYSFPTGLIDTARRLGLDGHVHVVPPVSSSLVPMFGERILDELQAMRIYLQDGPEEPLGPHQRRLRAVVLIAHQTGAEPADEQLRYVLERPDGSVMDPATGRNHDNPSHLNQMTKAGQYANTGVSVVIIDPHWKPTGRPHH
jgi:hypothetical protein